MFLRVEAERREEEHARLLLRKSEFLAKAIMRIDRMTNAGECQR